MLEVLWNTIQIFATGIIAIGGAGAIFVGLYRWAKKPDINRDEKIKEHEEKLSNDFQSIKELNKRQDETDEAMRILMKSMLALMSHAIDGNHTDDLKDARDEMHEFLLERRSKK